MNDIFVVPLSNSDKICIIDFEDSLIIRNYNWCLINRSNEVIATNSFKFKRLHSAVLETNKQIDHKSRDKLDNRKSNLRLATQQQNCFNRIKHKNSTSNYKGVHFRKDCKKWRANICIDYETYSLGTFKSEIEAAKAYDKAALKLFKEFAVLNFPVEAVITNQT